MRTFNTYFSTTQYPFSILYLPTQMQMDIVYQKPVLNISFKMSGVISSRTYRLFKKNLMLKYTFNTLSFNNRENSTPE